LLPSMLPTMLPTPVGSDKGGLSRDKRLLPTLPTRIAVGRAWDVRARTASLGEIRLSNFL